MYRAAECFSEDARKAVAAGSVFTKNLWGGYTDCNNRCIVGALLAAEAGGMPRGSVGEYPGSVYAKARMLSLGLPMPQRGELPALMKANDRGEFTTPEAVREALGV